MLDVAKKAEKTFQLRNNMLPKKKRVTKGVFQVLMKEGKTLSTRFFLFYFAKSDLPQYAFVAPKNIFKNAVKRNKFRRIGYNILRSVSINSGKGVFIYKKQSISAKPEEIKENILFILKKTGFLQ
jgi:ribonuclease P protein component